MLGAQTDKDLRGNYSARMPDFTVQQNMALYSETDRMVWRSLLERQIDILKDYAAAPFIAGVRLLDPGPEIPDFELMSDRIEKRTGWRLVAVPGFIPDEVFFTHLSRRRFPVCVWLRRPDELDYLVEPDLFHDFFGHVPLLLDPVFADCLQRYGRKGLEAANGGSLARLARFYWYMVEFGLIHTRDGLKAYGAGILSSRTETIYSIEGRKPRRLWFDLARVMRTRYMIDDFQKTYFVLPDFETLFDCMERDFPALYRQLDGLPEIEAGKAANEDRIYSE